MAERRMFSKSIIDSDAFLDMPLSTQCLYFHLSMRADDEGFINNAHKIKRMIGCSDDDLRLLAAKKFILPFESGIIVIKHWRIHNYIRADRYKETVYQEERSMLSVKENGSYTFDNQLPTNCQPDDNQMDTQDRIGKVRLGKVRLGEVDSLPPPQPDDEQIKIPPSTDIIALFNRLCPRLPKITRLSEARRKAVRARINSGYDLEVLFTRAGRSDFLAGQNNRNWMASFDWIVTDSNAAKIMDGNYDNKGSAGTVCRTSPTAEENKRAQEDMDRIRRLMRGG